MSTRNQQFKTTALFLIFLVNAALCEICFTPTGAAKGYLEGSIGAAPSEKAAAHALGEFRIVAANMIWLNVVDRYHHEYTEKGGNWSKNVSLLPYLKMVVWLDPHFVEAYDVSAAILSSTNQYPEAQKALDEGVKNNNESWQLQYDQAMFRAWCLKDKKSALPYAIAARDLVDDPFLKHRMQIFVNTLSRPK
jgi:hypothetical protein